MEILQPKVGDRVRVRQRTWVVRDVDAYEHCRVLTLASAGSHSPPLQRFIQPFDDVESEERVEGERRVSLRAWRRFCRSALLEDGPSTRWVEETESAHRERVERVRRELFVGMTRARDGLWLGFLS